MYLYNAIGSHLDFGPNPTFMATNNIQELQLVLNTSNLPPLTPSPPHTLTHSPAGWCARRGTAVTPSPASPPHTLTPSPPHPLTCRLVWSPRDSCDTIPCLLPPLVLPLVLSEVTIRLVPPPWGDKDMRLLSSLLSISHLPSRTLSKITKVSRSRTILLPHLNRSLQSKITRVSQSSMYYRARLLEYPRHLYSTYLLLYHEPHRTVLDLSAGLDKFVVDFTEKLLRVWL